jgi:catechol 2,3-dioxygenase-like lactoylglutathione lyase family enzyme
LQPSLWVTIAFVEPEVTALNHVQVAMPRGAEAQATAFYAGLLGLEQVAKPPQLASRGGCWFRGGRLELHLGVEDDFRPARKAHPALEVRGLAALRERLEAAGAEVVDDEPLAGYERCYVHDPFGNRLELMERTP